MRRLSLVVAGLLVPALVQAQLPDPSTRALGMGGAYSSLARGYEAVAWNPAMLATWGNPGFTVDLPHASLEVGSNAFGLSDFRKYANSYLSPADKQTLLDKIPDSLAIRTLVGVAPFGLSIGPFAFMVGASGETDLGVSKDAARLMLFGNAPAPGVSSLFTAQGSNGRAWAATTAAASLALPFSLPVGRLSVGATYKYVIGNFLGSAADMGTQATVGPPFSAVEAAQAVYTNYAKRCGSFQPLGTGACGAKAGNGYGVDLGAALQFSRKLTLSAVLVNAVSKMTWDPNRLVYERTRRVVTQDATGKVSTTVMDSTQLHTAAAIDADPVARAYRDSLLANADFARLARVGVALHDGLLSLAAGLQVRLKSGLDDRPAQELSAGAEYRLLGILPLRVGGAWDFGQGTTLAAGTGLQLLGLNVDASVANISGTGNPGVRVGVGVGLMW